MPLTVAYLTVTMPLCGIRGVRATMPMRNRHEQPRSCSLPQSSPHRPLVAGNFHLIEIHEACRLTGIRDVQEAKAVAFIESDGCGVVESIQNNLMKSITWVPWPAHRQSLATAKRPILTAGMIVRRLPLGNLRQNQLRHETLSMDTASLETLKKATVLSPRFQA